MIFKNGNLTYTNHSYIDFTSDAGSLSVNVARDEVLFRYTDLEMGEGTFKMNISHIYSNYCHISDTRIGNNWKLNIQQYITRYNGSVTIEGFSIGDYIYVDNEGYVHKFVLYDTNKYYDENGTGMTLYLTDEPYIECKDGSRLIFDSTGNLVSFITKGPNKEIRKKINYIDGKISSYFDTRNINRFFSFIYEEDKLKKILLKNNNKILECIYYDYDNGNLSGIYHYVNNTLKSISIFKYDSDNNLIFITGTNNGIALKIDYSTGIKVSKGISKVVKDNLQYLQYNMTLGENSVVGKTTVETGVKDTITRIGKFVNSISISNLGEDNVFDYIESSLNHSGLYEPLNQQFNSSIEETSFLYYTSSSDIITKKNINYHYCYNAKGFVTGVFESGYKTLTRNRGISLLEYGSSTGINGKPRIILNIGNGYDFLLNSDIKRSVNEYIKFNNYAFSNFVVSFWIRCNNINSNYLEANLSINKGQIVRNKVYLDNTAFNAWQYVSIPIATHSTSKETDFSSIIINVSSDGGGTYELSNIEICEGNITELRLANEGWTPSMDKFYGIKLLLSDNTYKEIVLDHNNFITESDILMAIKNFTFSEVFDFSYCANTKRVSNVKEIYFHYLNELEDEEILFNHQDDFYHRTILPNNDIQIDKNYEFEIDVMTESTLFSTGEYTTTVLDYQGRTIRTVDDYGIINENEYDDYGNLLSTTIRNESSGSKMLYTEYRYDNETEGGKYREMLSETQFQDSSVKIKQNDKMLNCIESIQFGDNYKQSYEYDLLNRIININVCHNFNKIVGNHYVWNYDGKLVALSDSNNYHYKLDYDEYGGISRYSICNNDSELTIKEKRTDLGLSSYGGDLNYDNNFLTDTETTIHNDKYGKPKKVSVVEGTETKDILFEYEELNESASIAKIKKVTDGFDNSITTYKYDNRGDLCQYSIKVDGQSYLDVQQISSQDTRYYIGGIRFKNEIINNNNYLEPRPIETNIYYDTNDSNNKDEWKKLTKFNYSYEYDPVLGVINKKTSENITSNYNFISPNSNNYSNQIQSITNKYKDDYNFDFDYYYDLNQNITKIEDKRNNLVSQYSYDKLNRLKTEYSPKFNQGIVYSYLDENNEDINRVTKVFSGVTKIKEYKYDNFNRLTHYYTNDIIKLQLYYQNILNPYKIDVDGISYNLLWTRDNLLKQYGNINFTYNYQQNRMKKTIGNNSVKYYYDGSKLLGEDYSTGQRIIYMYDLTGIAGVRFISANGSVTNYEYIRDGQNNIVAIIKGGELAVEYFYDAWGNTIENVIISDEFTTINPIRYKSYYYDIETKLYFINGRYYNPLTGNYLDSMDIENVVNDSILIGSLNLYSICLDNPIDNASYGFTIQTNEDLSTDDDYDPYAGYTWWDRNWKSVVRYTLLAVTLIVSIVLICIPATSAFGVEMFCAGIGSAISGMIISGVIGGLISAINGNGFWTGALQSGITGFVDGFISGAIMYCISAGISAISNAVRAGNATCTKPSNCFVAGTLVMTAEGMKAIEDIELGDKVWSWCEETGKKILNSVTTLFRNTTNELIHLKIAQEEVTTTKEHPFYVIGYGWKKAKELTTRDKVILYDDTIVEVDSITIELTDEPINIYNFEVENSHTYYVTDKGILVHNLCDGMVDDFTDDFINWLNDEKYGSNYEVYKGITNNGDDIYTGITRQGLDKRLIQHRTNGKPFAKLKSASKLTKNLTRNQARAFEQYYINLNRGINKINSISDKFKYYDEVLEWAEKFLVK